MSSAKMLPAWPNPDSMGVRNRARVEFTIADVTR